MVTASELSEDKLLVVFGVRATVGFVEFLPQADYASMSEEESAKIPINATWHEAEQRDIDLKCRD
jgi:hypothetical protein